jgi:hypothetical protein
MYTIPIIIIYTIINFFLQNKERSAQSLLSDSDKAKLLDSHSQDGKQQMIPLVMALVIFYGIMQLDLSSQTISIVLVVFLVIIGVISVRIQSRIISSLREADFPIDFIRLRSRMSKIRSISLIVFLGAIGGNYFWSISQIMG